MTTMSLPRFRVLEGEAGKKPKKRKREKGSFPVLGIILLVVLVLLAGITAAAYWYITANYTVTNVYVEGNVHYSNEEIMDMVMSGRYGNNSLYDICRGISKRVSLNIGVRYFCQKSIIFRCNERIFLIQFVDCRTRCCTIIIDNISIRI